MTDSKQSLLFGVGDILIDNCRDMTVRALDFTYFSEHGWYVHVQPLTETLENDTFFKTPYWIGQKCLTVYEG